MVSIFFNPQSRNVWQAVAPQLYAASCKGPLREQDVVEIITSDPSVVELVPKSLDDSFPVQAIAWEIWEFMKSLNQGDQQQTEQLLKADDSVVDPTFKALSQRKKNLLAHFLLGTEAYINGDFERYSDITAQSFGLRKEDLQLQHEDLLIECFRIVGESGDKHAARGHIQQAKDILAEDVVSNPRRLLFLKKEFMFQAANALTVGVSNRALVEVQERLQKELGPSEQRVLLMDDQLSYGVPGLQDVLSSEHIVAVLKALSDNERELVLRISAVEDSQDWCQVLKQPYVKGRITAPTFTNEDVKTTIQEALDSQIRRDTGSFAGDVNELNFDTLVSPYYRRVVALRLINVIHHTPALVQTDVQKAKKFISQSVRSIKDRFGLSENCADRFQDMMFMFIIQLQMQSEDEKN